ncbi:MAG: pilus assembly protein [Rhodospirillales bacterium]|nr:pilus assembly protein [Rhodospirillales bacterium]
MSRPAAVPWWPVSSSHRRSARGLAGDRRGTVAVEFGLVGLIFITLLLGTVELARYQILRQSLRSMAEEAARTGLIILQGNPCVTLDATALKTAVTTPNNPTPMLTPGNLMLTIACPAATSTGVRTVRVTATYPFNVVAPIIPALPALTASASLFY